MPTTESTARPKPDRRRGIAPAVAILAASILTTSLLALGGPSPAAAGPETAKSPDPALRARTVLAGIAVDVSVEPLATPGAAPGAPGGLVEGTPARFRFTLTDAATGAPLAGAYPAAWMDRRPPEAPHDPTDPDRCRRRVESLLGGGFLGRSELDLNAFYVLAMNEDPTLSVLDPLYGFGGSKLLALVELRSPAEDWALTPDGRRLFVTQPAADAVAVVETDRWRVATHIPVGPGPGRAVLAPDGGYLWVGHDRPDPGGEVSGVSVLAVANLAERARIATGRGPHDVAVTGDWAFAVVTNAADGTVSIVDSRRLEVVATLPTGREPISVTWCEAAGAAWVAHRDGTLAAVDPVRAEVVRREATQPGLAQVRCAPGGRLAFAVNPEADLLHVVDTAAGRIVQTGPVADGPDQVAFTSTLAYLRHRGSDVVLMVPLADAGRPGAPISVVDFPGGERPPGEGRLPSRAAAIVKAPGANAMLVANPADGTIYYYMEGMAAPMGAFANYGREPRAVLVVDRSLREGAPGVYETIAPLGRPGSYDLAFFLDAPRSTACFEVAVAEDPARAGRRSQLPLQVRAPALKDASLAARPGETVRLTLEAEVPQTGAPRAGVADLEVLVLLAPGRWFVRRPARDLGQGRYEVDFVPPEDGVYYLYAESASEGLPPGTTRPLGFVVAE